MKRPAFGNLEVPRETANLIDVYAGMVRAEAAHQNLVSATSLETFHERHVADSLQLVHLVTPGYVIDIGSGAGLPGVILALATEGRFTLVEPRRKRAVFLQDVVERLELASRVDVVAQRVETLAPTRATTITARAVARLEVIFDIAFHLSCIETRWVLPKGRTATEELARARRSWQGDFRLVPSLTDPEAAIVVAEGVRRRST